MHTFLLRSRLKKRVVDHINGDGLDNRKENLRIATSLQNSYNRCKCPERGFKSKYKGVNRSGKNKWRAQITADGKTYSLGCFQTEVEAALAFNKAAKKYHKEFSRLNVIKERESNVQSKDQS